MLQTYRKAGRMDPKKLLTRFDVEATELSDDEKRPVRAKPYKSNAYSEHSDRIQVVGIDL